MALPFLSPLNKIGVVALRCLGLFLVLAIWHAPARGASFANSLGQFQAYVEAKQTAAEAYVQKRYPQPGQEEQRQRVLQRYSMPGNHPFLLHHGRRTQLSVLLVHGFSDSPYYMEHLAEYFFSRGMNVIAILLPGHGLESDAMIDSEVVNLANWQNEIKIGHQLASQFGDQVLGVGFSTGASLLLESASYHRQVSKQNYASGAALVHNLNVNSEPKVRIRKPRLSFAGLVLLSPVLKIRDWRVRSMRSTGIWVYKQLSDYSFPPDGQDYDFKYLKDAINGVEQVQRLVEQLEMGMAWKRSNSLVESPPVLEIFSESDETVDSVYGHSLLQMRLGSALQSYVFPLRLQVGHSGFLRHSEGEGEFIDRQSYQQMLLVVDKFLRNHSISQWTLQKSH